MMQKKKIINVVAALITAFVAGVGFAHLITHDNGNEKDLHASDEKDSATEGLMVETDIMEFNNVEMSEDGIDKELQESTSKIDPDDYKTEVDWEMVGKIGKKAGAKAIKLGKSAIDNGISAGKNAYKWIIDKIE